MQPIKLTTEEIFSIIAKKFGNSDFELLNYVFEEPPEKIGLLGDHSTLHTTVNTFEKTTTNDSEEFQYSKVIKKFSFFVKFAPFSSESQLKFSLESGAFKKEIFIYELLDKVKTSSKILDCVPNHYFSIENRVIVTENLDEYKNLDKMSTLNYDTVIVVLKALAKLHVSSVLYEEGLGNDYRLIDEYKSDFEETFYNDKEGYINLKGVDASLKAILSEIDIFQCPKTLQSGKNFKETIQKIYYKIYELIKPNKSIRGVISHGDLWCTNFLIKHNKDQAIDCKFVDFQQARYLPPSHDLMCFLYLNTSRKFREEHMYEIIGMYYANLERLLKLYNLDIKDVWTFSDFMSSCEEQKLFAMLQTATYFQLVLADNAFLKEFMLDSDWSYRVLNEDRTELVVRCLEHSDVYKNRLRESILDLQDFCEYL